MGIALRISNVASKGNENNLFTKRSFGKRFVFSVYSLSLPSFWVRYMGIALKRFVKKDICSAGFLAFFI